MRPRFIQWEGKAWTLTSLSRQHGIATGTLYCRLQRFGETASGISRALSTGIMSKEAIGRLSASNSPWRYKR